MDNNIQPLELDTFIGLIRSFNWNMDIFRLLFRRYFDQYELSLFLSDNKICRKSDIIISNIHSGNFKFVNHLLHSYSDNYELGFHYDTSGKLTSNRVCEDAKKVMKYIFTQLEKDQLDRICVNHDLIVETGYYALCRDEKVKNRESFIGINSWGRKSPTMEDSIISALLMCEDRVLKDNIDQFITKTEFLDLFALYGSLEILEWYIDHYNISIIDGLGRDKIGSISEEKLELLLTKIDPKN